MTATDTNVSSTRHPLRIGLVGTFPPRRCGLATFTSDVAHSLRDAHDQVVVVALVDAIERSIPGAELQPVQTSERSAADVAVRLSAEVDVVLVQHEFGIFGGRDSAVLQAFTDHLTVPFVITLHTVLEQFRPWQLTALTAPLSSAAGVFVVSAARASTIEHHSNRCRRRSASTTSCTSATGSTTSTNCRRCSTPPTCSPRRMPTPSRSSAAPCRSRSLPVCHSCRLRTGMRRAWPPKDAASSCLSVTMPRSPMVWYACSPTIERGTRWPSEPTPCRPSDRGPRWGS